MKRKKDRLDAADVLNWEYICQIGEKMDPNDIHSFSEAIKLFAYDFASTARVEEQNEMLASLLERCCSHQSAESNEEVVKTLAAALHSSPMSVREFAKQRGVLLKKLGP